MPKRRGLNIQFPLGGLNRRGPYRQQSPYTTPDALNVRPFATLEGRERGGSRPGLYVSHEDRIETGPVRMLESMDIVSSATTLIDWTDLFDGTTLLDAWGTAIWNSNTPKVLDTLNDDPVYTRDSGATALQALTLDTAQTYRIEMYITPFEGSHCGQYKIFARMNDTTPNAEEDGITVELDMYDDSGDFDGRLVHTASGSDTTYNFTGGGSDSSSQPGWFIVEIAGDTITAYWNGTQLITQAVAAQTTKRIGFGMECTTRGTICLVDVFKVQYVPDAVLPDATSIVVASANGEIYGETFRGVMTKVAAGPYVRTDIALAGVQIGLKLYIGDYDTSTGRYVKVYDPAAGTVVTLHSLVTAGTVPRGCPCIARFRDRLVLAGEKSAANAWYMARQSDPTDWDYAEEDAQAAVAGSSSDAGVPGEGILSLVPYSDDYLLFGCETSLWIMRGDPAAGGSLDNLSNVIGIISAQAWTFGPSGEVIFLSRDGLFILPPGGTSFPTSVSREVLPRELRDIDTLLVDVMMEYDVQGKGVHIYLTHESSNEKTHWWFDWERKTFWPATLHGDHEPTAICRHSSVALEDSGVILGCRDGWLRRYSLFNDTDSGTAFTSYVKLGPLPLGNDVFEGKLTELLGVLANNSGDVTWEIVPGDTYESVVYGTALESGTWTKEQNYAVRPGGRGMSFLLKLTGTGTQWAIERITAITQLAGKQRLL